MTRSQRIHSQLQNKFSPTMIQIEDESHMHRGSKNPESHLKILIVADSLGSYSRVRRQQIIMELLKEEFNNGLHALSLRVLTQNEYSKESTTFVSPACSLSPQKK